jgi:hypothetical protein
MTRFALEESSPAVPPGISSRYLLSDTRETEGRLILVAAFDGTYPEGSLGNRHGAYIATTTLHGLHVFDADCVILDFRGLSYRWGNSLLQVFQDVGQFKDAAGEPGAPPFPVLAVTSDKCRAAFLSLVTVTGQRPPAWHFDDLDEAIQAGARAANAWLNF